MSIYGTPREDWPSRSELAHEAWLDRQDRLETLEEVEADYLTSLQLSHQDAPSVDEADEHLDEDALRGDR